MQTKRNETRKTRNRLKMICIFYCIGNWSILQKLIFRYMRLAFGSNGTEYLHCKRISSCVHAWLTNEVSFSFNCIARCSDTSWLNNDGVCNDRWLHAFNLIFGVLFKSINCAKIYSSHSYLNTKVILYALCSDHFSLRRIFPSPPSPSPSLVRLIILFHCFNLCGTC